MDISTHETSFFYDPYHLHVRPDAGISQACFQRRKRGITPLVQRCAAHASALYHHIQSADQDKCRHSHCPDHRPSFLPALFGLRLRFLCGAHRISLRISYGEQSDRRPSQRRLYIRGGRTVSPLFLQQYKPDVHHKLRDLAEYER